MDFETGKVGRPADHQTRLALSPLQGGLPAQLRFELRVYSPLSPRHLSAQLNNADADSTFLSNCSVTF